MKMKRITLILVLTLLLAFPALGAPPLHSAQETRGNNEKIHGPAKPNAPAQRAEDDTRSSLLSKISPPGVISVLRRGAAAGSTGSVDPGNKNKTHSQTVAEFFREHKWMYGVVPGGAVFIIVVPLVVCLCCCCQRNQKCSWSHRGRYHRVPVDLDDSTDMSTGSHQQIAERLRPKRPLEDNPEDNALRFFLSNNGQYVFNDAKLDDLGSRVQKCWYAAMLTLGEEHTERVILTVAPLSQSCPLKMHKHQKGLNKLLGAVKVHPFIHPILEVAYLAIHERVVIVQPKMPNGSLKDLIYKVEHPTLDWSQKYSRRSRGLTPEKVARYGRQVLEAMEFLYHKGFPINALGHVQSGNIFVVDNVCKLGGYENMLIGYKTRIYRLCKDHLEHFDTILFGHLIFEMSAGYELKQLVPLKDDYKTVNKSIVPILEFIFGDELSHSISSIKEHRFFDVLLPQLKDFKPAEVQLTDSMRVVLEKVRKNKPRVQKPPSAKLLKMTSPTSMTDGGSSDQPSSDPSSWKDRFHMPKQLKQLLLPSSKKKAGEKGEGRESASENVDGDDDDEPLLT